MQDVKMQAEQMAKDNSNLRTSLLNLSMLLKAGIFSGENSIHVYHALTWLDSMVKAIPVELKEVSSDEKA